MFFLRPLIGELKQIWNDGIVVRDTVSGINFKFHNALLLKINDFLAQISLSAILAQPACSAEATTGEYQLIFHTLLRFFKY